MDWREADADRWWVRVRCPDCEHWREGEFDRRQVEALDDELDRANAQLISDLDRVSHVPPADFG